MGMLVRATRLFALMLLFTATGSATLARTSGLMADNAPLVGQPGVAPKPIQSAQAPALAVSPTALAVTLPSGQSTDRTLTISNTGTITLTASTQVINASTVWQPLVFPTQKVAPELRTRNAIAADSPSDMLVYLNQQADLSGAYRISDWNARGRYVYNTLFTTARRSQSSMIQQLDTLIQAGMVTSYQSFYIVNAVFIHARTSTLVTLAARSDVAYIDATHTHSIPQPTRASNNGITGVEWGVAKIGADRVWSDFGDRGAGVVVASIDSGVQKSHPALIQHYRGTTTGSNDYNWYDPTGASPATPTDDNGHGTHTMGTMIGDDGGSNKIGVAPGATWIAAKGCATSTCADANLLAAAQWMLAPFPIGGKPNNGDPSKRPNVINNSWSGFGGIPWYQSAVQAWRAAAIFPIFAAGNYGPGAGSVGSPGDYAESFASGATDSSDQISLFSGRGPSSLTDRIKPDVSAPGEYVRSSINDGTYGVYSGTSMASPHIAGCVALILAAAPTLDVDQVEYLLTSTAVDLGNPGPDFSYGYGRIDCYAAVAAARISAAWLTLNPTSVSVAPGTSQTLTVHFDTSRMTAGVYNAQINISSDDPNQAIVTVPVTLTVPQGPTLSIASNVPVTSGEQAAVPISLISNGFDVMRAAFAISYDHTCLAFDATDANGDGLPDAISFSLPPQFSSAARRVPGDTDDTIALTITPLDQTVATLPDGILVTITFSAICQPPLDQNISALVSFMPVAIIAFNDAAGHTLSAGSTMHDGSVLIMPALAPTDTRPPLPQPTEESTPTPTGSSPTPTPTQPPTTNSTFEVFLPSVWR